MKGKIIDLRRSSLYSHRPDVYVKKSSEDSTGGYDLRTGEYISLFVFKGAPSPSESFVEDSLIVME